MSNNALFSDEFLDSISQSIVAIPERIRDEQNGRYCYPEEYHNKVCRIGNKFLIFNNSSYDEIPFNRVEFLINILQKLLNNTSIDTDFVDKFTEALESLTQKIAEIEIKIEQIGKKIENSETNTVNNFDISELKNTIDPLITEYLTKYTNKINDLEDKIINLPKNDESANNAISINDFQNLKKQFEEFKDIKNKLLNLIENYDNENIEFKNQLESINHQIATINPTDSINEEKLVIDIGQKIWEKIEKNLPKKENQNLPVEYESFKTSIELKFENLTKDVETYLKQPINVSTDDISLTQSNDSNIINKLCQLKLAGYSINEIITLKNNNIL